ncbi:MAG: hypothetical protein KA444_09425, partial [Bacteroidia bacterium]|nr:hypothetical protein [Bacteroidia bacterium]
NSVQVNPFGMNFDYVNISQLSTNIPSLPGDSILYGPAGNVTAVEWFNGTTITINTSLNPSVRGVVYKSGSSFGSNNIMFAYSRFGNGKVAAIGDSSPCDDGSGDSNDNLFDGYIADAGGNHRKLLMNATIWLATSTGGVAPTADFTGTPLTTCVGQTVTYTDNSTQGTTSYSWNFGAGATPATAATVGPHSVSYSTSGTKTISLTATNAFGSNTKTRTNYVTVNANCLTQDLGVLSLLDPAGSTCPVQDNPLQVRLMNYGLTTINFTLDPVLVELSISDPNSAIQSFSKSISTGTLAGGATIDITLDSTYDFIVAGNYTINANTVFSNDANNLNDAMTAVQVTVNPSFQSDYTVLSENIGTVTSTTSIAIHETGNGFQNDILTMSGTADVRVTTQSSGYATASAGANVFFTNSAGRNFTITGLNTSAYNNLELSFGLAKSPAAANGSDFNIQVSSDGINYTNLAMPPQPSGTAWKYVTASGVIPSVPNLYLRFTQLGTTNQYRIDDILLLEKITLPEISTLDPDTFCQGGTATLTAGTAIDYVWSNGMTTQSITVNTTGNYFVTETNASGCTATSDPISILVNPVYSVIQNRFIALGDSYTLPGGQVVNTTGTYNVILQTVAGCDSTIQTNLDVVNASDNNLCTSDFCDSLTGNISHVIVNVDDGNPCTIDGCNPFSGVYHIPTSEICGNSIDDDCDSFVDEDCFVTLNLKVMIEGFYLGNGRMAATIDSVNYPGVCDSLMVELHSSSAPFTQLYSDTTLIDIYGNGSFVFPGTLQNQSCYIVVRHRNTLETWTAFPVLFSNTSISYIFSDADSKAFGNNMKDLGDGSYALYSGDVDGNGSINLVDLFALENAIQLFVTGYSVDDLTGNQLIDNSDYSLMENNVGKNKLRP